MSVPVLSARAVTKRYPGGLALDGASLVVSKGECVALVGESGSGKTTLLRCFNRMVEPDAGEVLRDGEDTRSIDAVQLRRHTGYVQQEGGLLPHWTVLRNVALVPWLLGRPDFDEAAHRALGRVGLDPARFATRMPRSLSGGQRQRVAIARALAAEPEVVLLDEPFGALDAITRVELQDSFRSLVRELGVTALLVTHDLREAAKLGDRIAVMYRGRILQAGPLADLWSEPADRYVTELLTQAELRERDSESGA